MHHVGQKTEHAARHVLALRAQTYDTAGAIVLGSRARRMHRADSDTDVAILLHRDHQRFLITKLATADQALATALVLLDLGDVDVDDACNRAYYAMFDVAHSDISHSHKPHTFG